MVNHMTRDKTNSRPALLLTVILALGFALPASTTADPSVEPEPAVCTPGDGSDYWIDYCISVADVERDVQVLRQVGGDDPWCMIYPVPCAPGPDEPATFSTDTATLTHLRYEVAVNEGEIEEDVCGGDCPDAPDLCRLLRNLCPAIQLDIHIQDYGYLDPNSPVALADLNENGLYDGVAVKVLYDWYYFPVPCGELPFPFDCLVVTMTMDAQIVRLGTWIAEVCTPENQEYWVQHCEAFVPRSSLVDVHRAVVGSRTVCTIYPAPCVREPTVTVTTSEEAATLWVYESNGATNTQEMFEDLCQARCVQPFEDLETVCNMVTPSKLSSLDCTIYWLMVSIYYPPPSWHAANQFGLADLSGDGKADGIAIHRGPEVSAPYMDNIVLGFDMVVLSGELQDWDYVPFVCFQMDPVYISFTPALQCTFKTPTLL